MIQFLWLIPLGFVVGAYGTLIGAGGGFVLVPVLILLYPNESPEIITSISLAVVFFNALSGSAAYARAKRIDYVSGLIFSAATVPGAILGALTTGYIPRRPFDITFGTLLVVGAGFLVFRPAKKPKKEESKSQYSFSRVIVDGEGIRHTYSYNLKLGTGLSLGVGYFSSLLGIGGGIIHVPVLSILLNFPVHIATATSHFTLAVMSLTGTLVHLAMGTFHHGARRTLFLAVGVLAGAQLGAYWSNRVRGNWIIRSLAAALAFVGIRILIKIF